mgnify:CR=1 FL=1
MSAVARRLALVITLISDVALGQSPADLGCAFEPGPKRTVAQVLDGSTVELPGALMTVCPWWDGPRTRDVVDAQLRAFATEGVSHIMFWFADFPSHDGMRLFAEEVMPRWR